MAACLLGLLAALTAVADSRNDAASGTLPDRLSQTGLYLPESAQTVDPANLEFSPQYPLWSDGAGKRRWIRLPAGAQIDASQPDAWEFPPGTRLWKQFSHDRPIETRFIERLANGEWRFATYVWNAEGTDATLAPPDGIAALTTRHGPYAVPSETDCRACHEGAAVPVLGFSALQLSGDRDPLAPHAESAMPIDLRSLVARGWLRGLSPTLLDAPPRIPARSQIERAALGYLHGNCAHCHNDNGSPVPVDLTLVQSAVNASSVEKTLRSLIGARGRFRGHGIGDASLVAPGRPDDSVLLTRLRSRNPHIQMPPLGTRLPDERALALIEQWITDSSLTHPEFRP